MKEKAHNERKVQFALLYTRVSSKEQAKSGYSLEAQEEHCRREARRLNFKITKVFSDPGKSGRKVDNRPGLVQMLSFCAKNKDVYALFIWKLDRLSRETSHYLSIKAQLAKNGIKIISITEPGGETASDEFVETVLAAKAQLESAQISERVLLGMKRVFSEGRLIVKAPPGYKTVVRNDKKIAVPNEYFDSIKRAWQEMEKGQSSCEQMADKLNKWGARVPYGKKLNLFNKKIAGRIFRNPFYYGMVSHRDWGTRKGIHEPMISEETFFGVQGILDDRTRRRLYQRIREDFSLRGLILCDKCGRPLTSCWTQGKLRKYPYYLCKNNKAHVCPSVPRDNLEEEFVKLLENVKPTKKMVSLFLKIVRERYQERYKDLLLAKKASASEVTKIKAQRRLLVRKHLSGAYDDELFKEMNTVLKNELTGCVVAKGDATIEKLDIDVVCNFMGNFLVNLDKAWVNGSLNQRRALTCAIFPEKLVYEYPGFRTPKISRAFQPILSPTALSKPFGVNDGIRTRGLRFHRAAL